MEGLMVLVGVVLWYPLTCITGNGTIGAIMAGIIALVITRLIGG